MITYTLAELQYLLTTAARASGRKTLTCAQDVLTAIREANPPAEPADFGQPSLSTLTAVDIITDPTYQPGQFRLVRHDSCHVNVSAQEVTHGLCPAIADGTLDWDRDNSRYR